MTGRSLVGVDVGGTFTDLFFFDEGKRAFRTEKVPSQRGDEADNEKAAPDVGQGHFFLSFLANSRKTEACGCCVMVVRHFPLF